MPVIDGKLRIKVPAGTSAGAKLKLKGKGLPIAELSKVRADQIVIIYIYMPPTMTNEERELIMRIRDSGNFTPQNLKAGTGKSVN